MLMEPWKKKGTIKQYVNLDLEIFGQKQTVQLLITRLGKQKMLLGFPWLQKYNPVIDWQTGSFYWWHIPQKFDFRKKIESPLAKLSSLKPSTLEGDNTKEWMTWTVNALGTDCQDALSSPLIKIEEQIMDEGAWINPETNSVQELQ